MRPAEKWIALTQTIAATSLGISYFLPFYESAAGKTRYVNEWGLFFWPLPVLFVLYKISNRWLKAVLCLLAIIGGLLDYFLFIFLATYKSIGLIGYDIARTSIILLMISWLIHGAFSLFAPKHEQAESFLISEGERP